MIGEEFARQKKISLRKDTPGRRNSTIKEGRLMPRGRLASTRLTWWREQLQASPWQLQWFPASFCPDWSVPVFVSVVE